MLILIRRGRWQSRIEISLCAKWNSPRGKFIGWWLGGQGKRTRMRRGVRVSCETEPGSEADDALAAPLGVTSRVSRSRPESMGGEEWLRIEDEKKRSRLCTDGILCSRSLPYHGERREIRCLNDASLNCCAAPLSIQSTTTTTTTTTTTSDPMHWRSVRSVGRTPVAEESSGTWRTRVRAPFSEASDPDALEIRNIQLRVAYVGDILLTVHNLQRTLCEKL